MSSLRFFLFVKAAAAVMLWVVVLPAGGVQAGKRGVRALYIFGDSLVDVGNNRYLPFSIVRADFPHNGIDFPGHKATGRFSNGGNAADFIAMNIGLQSPPPYLSLAELHETREILTGVNFASGGARILGSTAKEEEQYIPLNKQIDHFIQVHRALVQKLGLEKARKHMASSLFVVVIGSNDIFHYLRCEGSYPPQMFVDFLVEALGSKLEMIYALGARMLVFVGAGPLGCCPSHRLGSQTRECDELANEVSLRYNDAVYRLLEKMKAEHDDLNYSFFNTYKAVEEYIRDPTSYGFVEAKAACCGLGTLNARVPCLPISRCCSNRDDHVFWDFHHPTQRTYRMLTQVIFGGSREYAYPINATQLTSFLDCSSRTASSLAHRGEGVPA